MSQAAKQRRATEAKILEALQEIGCGSLVLRVYPSGIVINDGDSLWTVKPGDILAGARRVKAELANLKRGAFDTAEEGFRAYNRLCSVTTYMLRGDDSAKRRHERCVKAWRRDHPGCAGNWA